MMARGRAGDLVRRTLQPVHRSLAGVMPIGWRRRYLYLAGQGRLPRLTRPRSFTEKVNWRIINDRRGVLAWTCDKLAMKEFAQKRSESDWQLRVPATLWSGTDLAEVVGRDYQTGWVL